MNTKTNNLEQEYTRLKEKHKDRFRLVYGKPMRGSCKEEYYIEYCYGRMLNYWALRELVRPQPQRGILSILNLGDYEYTVEQWAKKCFNEYVHKMCDKKDNRRIV